VAQDEHPRTIPTRRDIPNNHSNDDPVTAAMAAFSVCGRVSPGATGLTRIGRGCHDPDLRGRIDPDQPPLADLGSGEGCHHCTSDPIPDRRERDHIRPSHAAAVRTSPKQDETIMIDP